MLVEIEYHDANGRIGRKEFDNDLFPIAIEVMLSLNCLTPDEYLVVKYKDLCLTKPKQF